MVRGCWICRRPAFASELLSESLTHYALTDAQIERAALYRTLRTLEEHGYVTSDWEAEKAGPARRVYKLTKEGYVHLREWAEVMARLGDAMKSFSKKAASSTKAARSTFKQ